MAPGRPSAIAVQFWAATSSRKLIPLISSMAWRNGASSLRQGIELLEALRPRITFVPVLLAERTLRETYVVGVMRARNLR